MRQCAKIGFMILLGWSLGGCPSPDLAAPQDSHSPFQRPSRSGEPGPIQGPSPLIVAAQQHITDNGPNHGGSDFGVVDPLSTPRLSQVFMLQNDGKTPLVIERLQSSCGCTRAFLGKEGNTTSKTLASGETVEVRVAVDVTHFQGAILKHVWVYVQGNPAPAATLDISAQIPPVITAVPSALDFGRVSAGTSRSLPLTVTVDARLLRAGMLPALISSNPDVQVQLMAHRMLPSVPLSPSITGSKTMTRSAVRGTYRVTILPQAHIGHIFGGLSFASGTPVAADGKALPAAPQGALPLTIFLAGLVSGGI